MAYPTIFRNTADQAVTSYNYVDMISGKACIEFNGLTMSGTRVLTQASGLDSDTVIRSDATGGTGGVFTKRIDDDMDLKFTRPTIVEGTAIINLTHGMRGRTNNLVESYVIVRARKVISGVETDVATFQSETLSDATQTSQYNRFCAALEIPRTKFKRGDTLRFTIEVYIYGSYATQPIIFYCADPTGRAIPTDESYSGVISLPSHLTSKLFIVVLFNPLR